MFCAFCHTKIDPLYSWKGTSGFYCSEFCAEEYGLEPSASVPPQRPVRPPPEPRA